MIPAASKQQRSLGVFHNRPKHAHNIQDHMGVHAAPRPQNRHPAIQRCTHLTYLGREGQSKLLTDSSKVTSDKHAPSICPLRSHSSLLLPVSFFAGKLECDSSTPHPKQCVPQKLKNQRKPPPTIGGGICTLCSPLSFKTPHPPIPPPLPNHASLSPLLNSSNFTLLFSPNVVPKCLNVILTVFHFILTTTLIGWLG